MMQLTEQQKKEGWRIVKFDEIAKSVSKRVEPGNTDLEVYVGLEHLDPDNLRITRRGVPSDVTGQKLRVRPGQIIFGKRRAYQRKVAVADFDGICSAHAMVLEAIPKAVLPEYLPFFMQSDMFMERAVSISEGSLSPTIKWKTLANQEFPLPPRKRQEEMLEVYRHIEKAIQNNLRAQTSTLESKNALFHDYSIKKSNDTDLVLSDCLMRTPEYGANTAAIELAENTYRYIRVTDINSDGSLNPSVAAGATKNKNAKYLLDDEDVLIARTGATVGKPFLYSSKNHGEAIFAGYLLRLKFNKDKMIPQYFKHYTDTKKYWYWVEINARGAAQPNINAKQLEKIELSQVSVTDQIEICNSLETFYTIYERLKEQEKKLINLRKHFAHECLTGGTHVRI